MVLAVMAGRLKASWIVLTGILLIAASSAVVKDGYFLIGLLPLAIPLVRFPSKRLAISFKTINMLLIGVIATLFTLRTAHAVNGVMLTPTPGVNANSQQQITYITHHLASYVWHLIRQPFTKSFDTIYLGIVGILTNRLIYLSILVIGILYLCLFITYVRTDTLPAITSGVKSSVPIFLIIFYLTYLLVMSALYIGDTSVGAAYVNGFYGRYFLPIMPLLLIIPMSIKRRQSTASYLPVVLGGSIIGLVSTLLSLQ